MAATIEYLKSIWQMARLRVPIDDLVEVVFEAVANGDNLLADIDLVAGDGVDVGEGDDIGAVDADELLRRQFEGEGFQVVEREDRLGAPFGIDLGIVFHSFAEQDVFEFDLDDLVFGFDEDKPIIPVVDVDGGGEVVADLVHGREEPLEGEGAVEKGEDIHLRYFIVLFLFVGDTDDDWVIAGFPEAKHSPVIEEVDVPEDDVG